MTRSRTLAFLALSVGVLILLIDVAVNGIGFSFVLLFALLCIADGVIRLALSEIERQEAVPGGDDGARQA